MMTDGVARIVPTPNFFARAAYYRNSIVRGKTWEELLAALDKRMDGDTKNPGAVEFAAVFLNGNRRKSEARSGGGRPETSTGLPWVGTLCLATSRESAIN